MFDVIYGRLLMTAYLIKNKFQSKTVSDGFSRFAWKLSPQQKIFLKKSKLKFPDQNLNGSVLITTEIIIKNSAFHLAYSENLHVKSFKLSNLRDIS